MLDTSKLYVRDNNNDSWSWMTTNRTDCPGENSGSNGFVNCYPENSGAHSLMESGVNNLCEVGSTKDYKQKVSAILVKFDGSSQSGSTEKVATNIYCRG